MGKSKVELAKELNISRKTLYNYMCKLHIKELNESNIYTLQNYIKQKGNNNNNNNDVVVSLKNKIVELQKENNKLQQENIELKRKTDNNMQLSLYQVQVNDIYRERVETLEKENQKLLNIIELKEKREISNDIKIIEDGKKRNFFYNFFHKS